MKTNTWIATHTAWFWLCPIYLAEIESDAPVPIPRYVPGWWFEFNLTLNDFVCWVCSFYDADSVGYMFTGVKELDSPKTIEVESREEEVDP